VTSLEGEAAVEASAELEAGAGLDPELPAGSEAGTSASSDCPSDMVSVRADYCPELERQCTVIEHDDNNHLEICHAFAREQKCRGRVLPMAFCIDRYEYPNRKGEHPAWMVTWYQAQATCEAHGKRLCWAREWTVACEGPDLLPFPYGWERDPSSCNMDNLYIKPNLADGGGELLIYSKDHKIAEEELSRLDRSVPSGSMETCRSAFGVYDLPGNVDEWVVSDEPPRGRSKWAGLKGGGWGHVRSQCRPMTFSHDPGFAYYSIGFRCCRDVADAGGRSWSPSSQTMRPPVVPAHDFVPDPITVVDAPGPSQTKYDWREDERRRARAARAMQSKGDGESDSNPYE
jgi:hypothetical protein